MYNTSVPMASPSEELTKVVSGARFCTPEPLSIKTPRSSNLSQERIYQATTDVEEVAAAIQQQGWAVLRGAVPSALLEILKLEVPKAAEQLLHQDPQRIGNRGPRRYSWGGSSTSHHMVHLSSWAQLLDIHQLVQVLENVFQGEYVAIGGGGDFVLGETDSHQRLHVDLQLEAMYDSRSAAAVVANFVLSDISCHDGPVRLVPGTQNLPLASQLGKDWGYATHLQKGRVRFFQNRICHTSSLVPYVRVIYCYETCASGMVGHQTWAKEHGICRQQSFFLSGKEEESLWGGCQLQSS